MVERNNIELLNCVGDNLSFGQIQTESEEDAKATRIEKSKSFVIPDVVALTKTSSSTTAKSTPIAFFKKQTPHKNCVIAVMRHGQRMDKTFGMERLRTSFIYNDPPLTDEGKSQAFQTAYMIIAYKYQLEQKLNDGRPFDRVVLESSPFLRTMQTCAQVCRAMNISQFRINYEFCEHLEPKMQVGENPIPMLTIKQIKTEEDRQNFKQTYLDGVDFIDDDYNKECVEHRYPESDNQVYERAARAKFQLVGAYSKSQESVLHLVVTHGTLVRFFSQASNMRVKKAKYCSLSAISVKPVADSDEATVEPLANCRNNHKKQLNSCMQQ